MKRHERIWELDFLRGIAILLMIIFHTVVDMTVFLPVTIDVLQGFWYWEGKLTALLFIAISGVSATLGSRLAKRGFILICWGLLLTLITYLYDSQTYIRFGILHFLGSSLLLYAVLNKLPCFILTLLSILTIVAGLYMPPYFMAHSYLLPFGIKPLDFISMDYYPLLPWFGIFLSGAVIGKLAYHARRSLFAPDYNSPAIVAWLGQHSLAIYLIHQPVIISIILTIKRALPL